MRNLTHFTEELYLGFVMDPMSGRLQPVTERVTICPACRSIHSLRRVGESVLCANCRFEQAIAEIPREKPPREQERRS